MCITKPFPHGLLTIPWATITNTCSRRSLPILRSCPPPRLPPWPSHLHECDSGQSVHAVRHVARLSDGIQDLLHGRLDVAVTSSLGTLNQGSLGSLADLKGTKAEQRKFVLSHQQYSGCLVAQTPLDLTALNPSSLCHSDTRHSSSLFLVSSVCISRLLRNSSHYSSSKVTIYLFISLSESP